MLNSGQIEDVKLGMEIALNFKENREDLVLSLLRSYPLKWFIVSPISGYNNIYRSFSPSEIFMDAKPVSLFKYEIAKGNTFLLRWF